MNRRLYRSRTDRMLGGVAGGLAEYFATDPALVRIAWAILTVVTGGGGFLVYIIAWIVVPEAPVGALATGSGEPLAAADTDAGETQPSSSGTWTVSAGEERAGAGGNAALWIGGILVLVGAWLLVRQYVPISIPWHLVWPLAIVGIGLLILVGASRRPS